MKKIFVSIAAAGVLVAGAFAASTVADSPAHAQTAATTAIETDGVNAEGRPDVGRPSEILDEVLAGLVADGTLDQGEVDAIKEALEAKREEVRAEMEAWREANPGRYQRGFNRGFAMGGLLEDGVIDADELAELPDGHPFKDADGPAADYLADGQLTEDELHQMGEQFHERRAGDRGASTDT